VARRSPSLQLKDKIRYQDGEASVNIQDGGRQL
jgi:hypothetical protein